MKINPLLLAVFIGLFTGSRLLAVEMSNENRAPISDSIDVLHYSIHLDIINLSTKSISGYADLQITPKVASLSTFYLWLLKLNVDSVLVNSAPVPHYNYNDTILRITLPAALSQGDTFTLRVRYHGMPVTDPSTWGGFYFTNDSVFAYNLGVGFESIPHNFGRVWFPCIDDFVDRATYDCHIRTKDDKMAVCGGTLMSSVDHGDGTKTWHWRMHNTIPSYLASVAVGPYVAVSGTYNGIAGNIPTSVYARPGDTNNVKNAFVNLNDILAAFEHRFGPYRFERVGYVCVPFNAGAMEHATNVAYPIAVLSAGLAYESLCAHELAHSWFGNLVTCATAEDMWINEGWARYSEAIYKESLYGKASYKSFMRPLLQKVVQLAHVADNGYRALAGMSLDYTYGTTVYDKGGIVIHTMRSYLGDSLFFDAVQGFLQDYAFHHISTEELRDYMTMRSGVDMTDFFDTWVLSPGFPHFSIDSFVVQPGLPSMVTVYVRQRLNNAPAYAQNNILEITLMDNNWNALTDTIRFSGMSGTKTFAVPFVPEIALMDPDDKVSDAITAFGAVIKNTGNLDFPTTHCQLTVTSVTDSAFVRIEHNYVPPDPMKTANPDILRLSNYRYWKVDGIFPPGFVATAKFRYNNTTNQNNGYLDNVLMPTNTSKDSLLLLYRRNTADDWRMIHFSASGFTSTGNLIIDTLKPGEYTLAIGTPYTAGANKKEKNPRTGLFVYPNPSSTQFTMEWTEQNAAQLSILNDTGTEVGRFSLKNGQTSFVWNPGNIKGGNYVVQLFDKTNNLSGSSKIIYIR